MKTVAAIQSSYLPWKGYFDIIHDVDMFIFYDHVQYTKNDWRNRNQIKGPNGVFWLTIPISREAVQKSIDQVSIPHNDWQKKHLKSICESYSTANYFHAYIDFFKEVYVKEWHSLSDLNQTLIREISLLLGLNPQFLSSSDFHLEGKKTDALIYLLKQVGAGRYVSGPSAKEYIEEKKFAEAGIELIYKEYHYPEYPQLWGSFVHSVSIIDMLFNLGGKTPDYIWGKKQAEKI